MGAILLVVLTACQSPSPTEKSSPVQTVQSYLDALAANDYDAWKAAHWKLEGETLEREGDLGVLSLEVEEIVLDDAETERMQDRYSGSDLAASRDWSPEFIQNHTAAVYARYRVDYDNTKVPYEEGEITVYFYLLQENDSSPWVIWDRSYDINK